MKILVINAGSSSLKASLFEHDKKALKVIAKAMIDGLGQDKCRLTFKSDTKNIGLKSESKNHSQAVKEVLDTLTKTNTIKDLKEISTVGQRVVHGGEKYIKSVKIDTKVIKEIEKLSNLAPLHNPINLEAIKAVQKLLPKAKQVAVFDTAFHQTMPEKAYLYGLPQEMYKKHQIRRYGFHGSNHKYVIDRTIALLKNKKAKIISCHLGNGNSITASIAGESIDTSMGFTPLEGVMMGTRSGSIDPAITFHLQHNLKMKPSEVDHMLNKESGLLGFSGISSDMRDIYEKAEKGDKQAKLAIETLAYQIAKYCGAYAAAMNGVDAITFTAGMGEKAWYLREKVIEQLAFLDFKLDKAANKKSNKSEGETEIEISPARSKKRIFVIQANEALQIAMETTSTR